MSNTSKKYKQKRAWIIGLIALGLLLVISFAVSKKDAKIDTANITETQASDLKPHYKGNAEAELVLVEHSDFQCPACKAAAPDVKRLVEEFGDSFKLEYRHFPLRSIHPNAQIAAQASEAAGVQGKFWEMHDMLFDNQDEWAQSFNPKRYFEEYAVELGLNIDQFMYDLESDIVKDLVDSQFNEANTLQLPGTPSFTVNGVQTDFNEFVNGTLIPLQSGVSVEVNEEVAAE